MYLYVWEIASFFMHITSCTVPSPFVFCGAVESNFSVYKFLRYSLWNFFFPALKVKWLSRGKLSSFHFRRVYRLKETKGGIDICLSPRAGAPHASPRVRSPAESWRGQGAWWEGRPAAPPWPGGRHWVPRPAGRELSVVPRGAAGCPVPPLKRGRRRSSGRWGIMSPAQRLHSAVLILVYSIVGPVAWKQIWCFALDVGCLPQFAKGTECVVTVVSGSAPRPVESFSALGM